MRHDERTAAGVEAGIVARDDERAAAFDTCLAHLGMPTEPLLRARQRSLETEVSPNLVRRRSREGRARNETRSPTPAPLHFQSMPETGACGKPQVVPHTRQPHARNDRRRRIECTTNPDAVWPWKNMRL